MRSDPRMLAAVALCLGGLSGVALHATREAGLVPTMSAAETMDAASAASASAAATLSGEDFSAAAASPAVRTRVDAALGALQRSVSRQSHPDALRRAFQAYYNYKAANPGKVRNPYLFFVDYGLDNQTPRGYVFDMDRLRVVEGPFTVAHGRGSGSGGIPTKFSNRNGSNSTSLGLYLAQETYAFRGKSGGRAYQSVGLRLSGLSGAFNSAARSRGVVVHGAPYVTAARAGRSEGCPAMEPARARRLIPKISNGGMVFLFSPRDSNWMTRDPWAARVLG